MTCLGCGYQGVCEDARFCTACGKPLPVVGTCAVADEEVVPVDGEARPVAFWDFQIRAWQADAEHAQVLVHSSPVGGMRRPTAVSLDAGHVDDIRATFRGWGWEKHPAARGRVFEAARSLSQLLLPAPVLGLLIRSLERIPPEDGLRVRLCLDESLVDLPWEFLYRPDAPEPESLAGFLALNPRISLVREAPLLTPRVSLAGARQRMLFAGALFSGEHDPWEVREEHRRLAAALAPLADLLEIEFFAASDARLEAALTWSAPVFHYSGHADVAEGDHGYLVREVHTQPEREAGYLAVPGEKFGLERLYLDPMSSERLAGLLRRAGTRLAVFSACNSGRWGFVRPLILAGVPAIVGTQGIVFVPTTVGFCEKMYATLAVGLSLDEAVTWARLHVLQTNGGESFDWASFMVYLPATETVLFPRTADPEVRERQGAVQRERQQTIINVVQHIGSVQGGQVAGVMR